MRITNTILFLAFTVTFIRAQVPYYYPPLDFNAEWETTNPADLGWCAEPIDSLYAFLDENNTKGFIILKSGKIVLEQYFDSFTKDSIWYWASAAKSLTSVLIGFAQEEGLLSIEYATSDYLGVGWTNMDSALENQIKIVHQLSMSTGIDDNVDDLDCLEPACLDFLIAPGERWAYHNAPYRLLLDVIDAAAGRTINGYTDEKLRTTIGMRGFWLNYIRYSRARDLARFGHFVLSDGIWAGDTLLFDTAYLHQMARPSQASNPAYGYLWWLNGQDSYMYPGVNISFNGPLFPTAPADMYSAQGRNDQKIYVVPSLDMVVVRIGNNAFDIPFLSNSSFDTQLWNHINQLNCTTTSLKNARFEKFELDVFPNPAQDWLHLKKNMHTSCGRIQIVSLQGTVVDSMIWPVDQDDYRINIQSLLPGVYFLQIENGPAMKFLKR